MQQRTIQRTKGKNIKAILEILFFSSLMVFALLYILKDDPTTTFRLISGANFFPLALAIFLLLSSTLLDGLNITLLARLYNGRYHYYQGVINVLIGQVMGVFVKSAASIPQAITFTRQDIRSPQAASILTMNYLIYQFSLLLYSLVMVLFGYPYIKEIPIDVIGGLPLYIVCIFALFVQFLTLMMILLLGFTKSFHRLILFKGINFLSKMHLLRNKEATRRKLTLQFATYRIEMKRLFQHKFLVLFLVLSNLGKLFLLGMIPFVIFNSLDVHTLLFFPSLFTTGIVNTISSLISVGVPEVLFQSSFRYYLSSMENASSLASAANLLWRSVTFYLSFFMGLLTFLFYRGAPKKEQLLMNTSTIYDFELSNLLEADDKTKSFLEGIPLQKETTNAPLLSERQVERSFRKLQKRMIHAKKDQEEIPDEDLVEILEKQRMSLAKIEKEVSMVINQAKPDKEIQKEAEKDLSHIHHAEKKREERKKRRLEKKGMKNKAKLLKLQPKGTTIKEGEDGEIVFTFQEEIVEYSSLPSQEPETHEEKIHR